MKIQQLWAYISVDDKGNEGVCGWLDQTTKQWLPMIAADEDRLKSIRPLAEMTVKQTKKAVKIVKFTVREEIEELNGNNHSTVERLDARQE